MKILIIILCIMAETSYGQRFDSIQTELFNDFSKIYINEGFDIIGEIETKVISDDEAYFLFKVIPIKEGVQLIKQVFEHKPNYGYKNNSLLNIIKTSKKGGFNHFSQYQASSCRIGDTIVIPVFWNKHIIKNKFKKVDQVEKEIYGKVNSKSIYKVKDRQLEWQVTNTVNEVKVLNINSSYAIYRGLRDEGVNHSITIKAIKTGKFTVKIGAHKQKIVILPKNAIISKTVTQVIGYQWEERVSSTGWPPGYNKAHFEKQAELRVGDTLSITFLGYVQEVLKPKEVDTKVLIEKLPFE